MKVFFIIKHNSQRIKKKNFKKILNLELYKKVLYKFKNFKVFVDTDSERIIKSCKVDKNLRHVFCYRRDKKFIEMERSNTKSPTPLMIKNFLDNFTKVKNEVIITSHVTSPFIKISTIKDALKIMKNYDSVSSVQKIQNFSYLETSNFNKYNQSYNDYKLRFKDTTNLGRHFIFCQLGIPFISDIYTALPHAMACKQVL